MRVVATPNRAFPPGDEPLSMADVVLDSITDLTVEAVSRPATSSPA